MRLLILSMNESAQRVPPPSAPSGADYFSVFDLQRKLDLDPKALERAFYRKSRAVHPDRFAQAEPEQQQWSLEQTSLLNDAYRTLKDPVSRTEYLLRLEGVSLEDESGGKRNAPPELLAEVFELNMQLEEMRMNRKMGEDDPQLRSDLEKTRADFEGRLSSLDVEMQGAWRLWDEGEARDRELAKEQLAALLDKRRYLRNLVRDVREALGGA